MGYTGERKREYQRKWRQQRRDDWFAGKACVICGSADSLELDHIDPNSKSSRLKGTGQGTGTLWSWKESDRLEELAKCQVLCKTHHAEKTAAWNKSRRQHGRTLYNDGCRCDVCREAQKEHNRQRFASKA